MMESLHESGHAEFRGPYGFWSGVSPVGGSGCPLSIYQVLDFMLVGVVFVGSVRSKSVAVSARMQSCKRPVYLAY